MSDARSLNDLATVQRYAALLATGPVLIHSLERGGSTPMGNPSARWLANKLHECGFVVLSGRLPVVEAPQ